MRQRGARLLDDAGDLAQAAALQVMLEGLVQLVERAFLVGRVGGHPAGEEVDGAPPDRALVAGEVANPGVEGELGFRRQPPARVGHEHGLKADVGGEGIPARGQLAALALQRHEGADVLPVLGGERRRAADAHGIEQLAGVALAEHPRQAEGAPPLREVGERAEEFGVGERRIGDDDRARQELRALRGRLLQLQSERVERLEGLRRFAHLDAGDDLGAPGHALSGEHLALRPDAHDLAGDFTGGDERFGAGVGEPRQLGAARLRAQPGEALQLVVRPDQADGVRQGGGRGQLAAGIGHVAPGPGQRGAQAGDVLRGEARGVLRADAERIGDPLELPGVSGHFRGSVLRVDGFALQVDAREVEPGPAPEVDVGAQQAVLQGVGGLFEPGDLPREHFAVEALDLGGDPLDGALELLQAFLLGGEHRQRERADVGGQVVDERGERRVAHGGHQHAAAVGQPVADDVGNGVGLAGAGRPLHHHAVGDFEQLGDARLLVVEGLGEEQVEVAVFGARRAVAQPAECRQLEGRGVCRRFGDQRRGGRRQRCVVGQSVQRLAQALEVLHHGAGGAGAGEEHPGFGNLHRALRRRRLKEAAGDVHQRRIARRIERRDGDRSGSQVLRGRLFHLGERRQLAEKRVQLEARVQIAGDDFDATGLRVEAHVHRAGHQRIREQGAGALAHGEAHSPDQLDRALGEGACELLLKSEQPGVQLREPPPLALALGPGLPHGVEVLRVLLLDLGPEGIVGEAHGGARIGHRVHRVVERLGRAAGVAVRAGRDQRRARDFGRESRRRQHRRADAQPWGEPGAFGHRRHLGTGRGGDRQPDLFAAIGGRDVQARALQVARLVIEQREAAVVGDVRDRPRART